MRAHLLLLFRTLRLLIHFSAAQNRKRQHPEEEEEEEQTRQSIVTTKVTDHRFLLLSVNHGDSETLNVSSCGSPLLIHSPILKSFSCAMHIVVSVHSLSFVFLLSSCQTLIIQRSNLLFLLRDGHFLIVMFGLFLLFCFRRLVFSFLHVHDNDTHTHSKNDGFFLLETQREKERHRARLGWTRSLREMIYVLFCFVFLRNTTCENQREPFGREQDLSFNVD